MQPSASLCRTQGAIQLARAESATLVNVRRLAAAAAAAWLKEADDADKREARRESVKTRSGEAVFASPYAAPDDNLSEDF